MSESEEIEKIQMISETPITNKLSTLSSSSRKGHIPTPKMSERKRSLFPCIPPSEDSNDLGRMSPLQYSTSSDSSRDSNDIAFSSLMNDSSNSILKANIFKNASLLTDIEQKHSGTNILLEDNSTDSSENGKTVQKSFEKNLLINDQSDTVEIKSVENFNFHNALADLDQINFVNSPSLTTFCDKENVYFDEISRSPGRFGFKNRLLNDNNFDCNVIIPETPPKKDTPKTPYETLNSELDLPKLTNRKSLLSVFNNSSTSVFDESLNEKYIDTFQNSIEQDENSVHSLKRRSLSISYDPISPIHIVAPQAKMSRLDLETTLRNKIAASRAKASLFNQIKTNDETDSRKSFSPKRFYANNSKPTIGDVVETRSFYGSPLTSLNVSVSEKLNSSFPPYSIGRKSGRASAVFLCKRKTGKRSYGEINAGVRTGIKKAKPKLKRSVSKSAAFKVEALKMISDQQKKSLPFSYKNSTPTPEKLNKKKSYLPLDQIHEMDGIMKQLKSKPVVEREVQKERQPVEVATFKRPLSPEVKSDDENEQPQKIRKFFKSKRSQRTSATVNLNKNFKLKMENGKLSLDTPKNKQSYQKSSQIFGFCSEESENLLKPNRVNDIIQKLDVDLPISNENPKEILVTVDVHRSDIEMNNEAEKPVSAPYFPKIHSADDIMISPTSLMCNMTSGLALHSPKHRNAITKVKNLTDKLSKCSEQTNKSLSTESMKLYPLFSKGYVTKPNSSPKQMRVTRSSRVKPDEQQYQIDAGQKRWGCTQCHQCGLVYQQGEPYDEQKHHDHHNSVQELKFMGWKNERVVARFDSSARIIEIRGGDPKSWWKKVIDVLHVVDTELGYASKGLIDMNKSKVYFYIDHKQIIGVATVQSASMASRMISDTCCSEETLPVTCGVQRLWTSVANRRSGVATRILDTIRNVFRLGVCLTKDNVAFSTPTELGREFLIKYTGTRNFLVLIEM